MNDLLRTILESSIETLFALFGLLLIAAAIFRSFNGWFDLTGWERIIAALVGFFLLAIGLDWDLRKIALGLTGIILLLISISQRISIGSNNIIFNIWQRFLIGIIGLLLVSTLLFPADLTLISPFFPERNALTKECKNALVEFENESIATHFSYGERELIIEENAEISPSKEKFKYDGIEQYKDKKYSEASISFQHALDPKFNGYKNSPETLIYLNNSLIGDAPNVYVIAAMLPIIDNGIISDYSSALEGLRGIAQAQDEINKNGGISGHKIKVLLINDSDDKEIGKQVVSKVLKDHPDVLGVIGHQASSVMLASSKIYTTCGLTVVSPTSTSVELSKYPHLFRTVPSDSSATKTLVQYMKDRTARPDVGVAFFYDKGSDYPESFKQSFEEEGGRVIDSVDFLGDNFNAYQAMKSLNDEVEAIYLFQILLPEVKRLELFGKVVMI